MQSLDQSWQQLRQMRQHRHPDVVSMISISAGSGAYSDRGQATVRVGRNNTSHNVAIGGEGNKTSTNNTSSSLSGRDSSSVLIALVAFRISKAFSTHSNGSRATVRVGGHDAGDSVTIRGEGDERASSIAARSNCGRNSGSILSESAMNVV